MLQSPSPPSHFISISSQEAGNNLQINCHFYGAEAAGWDSLCPPIKDDVAVKKIKGKFPLPRTLRPAHSVSLVCDARCLSGCGGSGVFSVSRLASPGCFPTYLRNVLDIRSECFWVGIHVLRSKCVPVVLLMKTWTFAHDLTDQHNYMKWKMHEKVIVNCFVTSDVFMSADSSFRRGTLTWMTHRMFFGVRSCCVSQSTVDRSAIVSHSVVWIIQQRCYIICHIVLLRFPFCNFSFCTLEKLQLRSFIGHKSDKAHSKQS